MLFFKTRHYEIQENQQGLEMDGTYQFLSGTDVNLSSEKPFKSGISGKAL